MKTKDDYLAMDYGVTFNHDPDGGYFVKILGVPGCMSQGETFEEACAMIVDAFGLWLEVALEDGDDIPSSNYPSPIFWDDYTAIMLLRFVRNIAKIENVKGE